MCWCLKFFIVYKIRLFHIIYKIRNFLKPLLNNKQRIMVHVKASVFQWAVNWNFVQKTCLLIKLYSSIYDRLNEFNRIWSKNGSLYLIYWPHVSSCKTVYLLLSNHWSGDTFDLNTIHVPKFQPRISTRPHHKLTPPVRDPNEGLWWSIPFYGLMKEYILYMTIL